MDRLRQVNPFGTSSFGETPQVKVMVGATPCILCHSSPEDVDAINFCNTCTLSSGGACSACQDYIAFEAQISATKQALDDLLSQRPKMRTRVNQNHDLFTRSVPLEIVYSVFQFSVPEKWTFDGFDDANPESRDKQIVSTPLLLGSICRTWRNIAWGMKPLWTVFRLNLTRLQNPNKVTLTREWLDRAGQLPLSIQITSRSYNSTKQEHETTDQLLALVNERSEQWKCLDLVDSYGWTSQLIGGSRGAPNLQTLKLGHNRSRRSPTRFSLAGSKPQPSQLSLHDLALNSIDIEYDRLTHVYLSDFYLDECIELLRRAPNLVYYRVSRVYENSNDFPIHDKPIICPNLEFIEFDCPYNEESQAPEIMTFFKSFTFPNLKHLKLQSGGSLIFDPPNGFSWDPMVAHIVDASPPLVSLVISLYTELHPIRQCIFPILRRTPFLRDLEMYAPFHEEWEGEQNEFFNMLGNTSILADDSTQPSFLPNLQSIQFDLGPEEEPHKFWESVSGIFGPISEIHNPRRRPLTTLRVRDNRNSEDLDIRSKDAVLQLLRLGQEGIVLDLKDMDGKVDLLECSAKRHGLHQWSNGNPQLHLN